MNPPTSGTVIVSGASSGIGRATALRLAGRGMTVVGGGPPARIVP